MAAAAGRAREARGPLLLLLLLAAGGARALPCTGPLSARGDASVTAPYDQAEVSVTVESRHPDSLATAANASASAAVGVADAIAALGVPPENLTTTRVSFGPEFRWDDGEQTLVGYSASNTVNVRLGDLALAPEVMDAAVRSAGEDLGGVTGPSFGLSREARAAAMEQAVQLAVAQSQRKADLMAAAAAGNGTCSVVGLLSLSDEPPCSGGGGPVPQQRAVGAPQFSAPNDELDFAFVDTPIFTGSGQVVSASVWALYEIYSEEDYAYSGNSSGTLN